MERLTAGGFDEISYVTLLIPSTSLVMREDNLRRTSAGKTNQSAVMKSSDWTARSAITCTEIHSDNGIGRSIGESHLLVRPLVAHDTDGLDGQQHCERLADLVIQACLADLGNVDVVGLLQNLDLLACNGAENTDSETGAGEGVTLDKVGGDREEATESSDFVYWIAILLARCFLRKNLSEIKVYL